MVEVLGTHGRSVAVYEQPDLWLFVVRYGKRFKTVGYERNIMEWELERLLERTFSDLGYRAPGLHSLEGLSGLG